MRKEEFRNIWKDHLKKENNKWPAYYDFLIKKFFKLKNIKREMRKYENINIGFGQLFEKLVSYVLGELKVKSIKKYVTQKEDASGKIKNDGIDIIYPIKHSKELLVIQVKSGKNWKKQISNKVIKLEVRSKELLKNIQSLSLDEKDLSKNYSISKSLSKELLEEDNWKIKTIFVTPSRGAKSPEMNETKRMSLEELNVEIAKYKPSYKNDIIHKKIFTINGDFSGSDYKTIIKGENDDLSLLITPIKINDLLEFLDKINDDHIDSVFNSNVRDDKGDNQIAKSIIKSLNDDSKDFFAMNNGIALIATKISTIVNGSVYQHNIEGIDIINGQQTLRTIYKNKDKLSENAKKKYILVKAFKKKNDIFARDIASASNTQTKISAYEIISTYSFNRILQEKLLKSGIFFSYRTGKTKFSTQFKNLPKISLKEILKYAIIKENENVWAKNNLNKFMTEIAYEENKDKLSKISKIIKKSKEDEKIVEFFMPIADLMVKNFQLKSNLKYSQSFDFFSYFFMKDSEKAISFMKEFNKINTRFIKDKRDKKEIPGDNIANIYKSKKRSKDLFEDLKLKFKDFKI